MPVTFVHAKYRSRVLARSIARILRSSHLCSLATLTSSGRPHINTAFYCVDSRFRFFFISDTSSRHGRNLARTPQAAMTIFDSAQRWGAPLHGIQLFGTCRRVRQPALADHADRCYRSHFPAYARWCRTLNSTAVAELASSYFVFIPRTLTLFDERRFGEEIFLRVRIRRGDA